MAVQLKKEEKHWIGIAVAILTALAALGSCVADFKNIPDTKSIARNIDTKEVAKNLDVKTVAANIDIEALAQIIIKNSPPISKKEIKESIVSKIPLPLKKPAIKPLNSQEKNTSKGMTKLVASCLMLAAQTYQVPPAVLVGIYATEEGNVGEEIGPFSDGSYLLGPMKITSNLIPLLAENGV